MKKLLMTWLAMIFLATPGLAEDPLPTSVRELIVIGLENNIGLQIEQINIPLASTVIETNDAVFDPELFAVAGYAKTVTPIASAVSLMSHSESQLLNGRFGIRKKFKTGLMSELALDTQWLDDNDQTNALDPSYRTGLEFNLTQPLLRNFGEQSNTSSMRIARNQLSQSELQHLLQAQALALQIELLTAQFAGEKEIVDLRTEAVVLAEELHTANRKRFETGVIPISEVQEAETALANRELNLSLALQSKELNFEKLKRQLNVTLADSLGSQQFFPFSTDLVTAELPAFEQLFATARDKNIDLQRTNLGTLNAKIEQDFYQNQLLPQLDLTFQAGLNGLSGDERNQATSVSYSGSWSDAFSRAADADGYQWGAGLQFSIPLGNRAAKSRLRQAVLRHRQADYQLRDVEAELRSQLQLQVTNLQRAVEQVKIAARFENLAKISLQQEQRRQEEGLSDTFRVISFQDKMINAKIGRINALVNYYASLAQLSFTRGIILEQHSIILSRQSEENSSAIM